MKRFVEGAVETIIILVTCVPATAVLLAGFFGALMVRAARTGYREGMRW